jgi:NADH-quinone oxidoreductase subunit C
MSTADLLASVNAVVTDHEGVGAATADESFGCVTIDVPADRWAQAATALREDPRSATTFFDWLSAYDGGDAGLAVVVRLWSLTLRHGVILRTHVARDGGRLPTLTTVWAGADWHERETFEMFGVGFDGHPNLVPLLLPDGFEGNPLRKEFVLASRVAKAWPGAKEPGESDHDLMAADGTPRPRRRTIQPPGVPAPGSWGPES